ncbi:HD family hydrolase [Cupriavidus necator]|uniref:HD family hydrolase n=1 Tax=Cupriavidus necator TaxID=106590 RepID=UPI00339D5ED2
MPTRSGLRVNLAHPEPEQFDIRDIALGLARECRYANQLDFHYSVAQHSVIVARHIDPEFALDGLLHDASEAYIRDLPSPLKALLPDYKAVETRIEQAIGVRFGLSPDSDRRIHEQVKAVDRRVAAAERQDLLPPIANPVPLTEDPWHALDGIEPIPEAIVPGATRPRLPASSTCSPNTAIRMFSIQT